jgi:hypothetical protein
MKAEELSFLNEQLANLNKANATLAYSYQICSQIGAKDEYTDDEQDRFESLTSKFARLSDIILKQMLKTIDVLDLDEPTNTLRDGINRAEKKELISSAADFIEIRKLRNQIAHEYVTAPFTAIFHAVLEKTPIVFDAIDRIERYCQRYESDDTSTG